MVLCSLHFLAYLAVAAAFQATPTGQQRFVALQRSTAHSDLQALKNSRYPTGRGLARCIRRSVMTRPQPISPTHQQVVMSADEAARRAWLAKQDLPSPAGTGGYTRSSEAAARAAWLAKQEVPSWGPEVVALAEDRASIVKRPPRAPASASFTHPLPAISSRPGLVSCGFSGRLMALGGSALSGTGRGTARPAIASGARASRLEAR